MLLYFSNTTYPGGTAGSGSTPQTFIFIFADYLSTQENLSYNPATAITTMTNLEFTNSTVSYVPTTLNYYEIYNTTIAFTGAIPSTNANFKIIRIGNFVSIIILNNVLATATSSAVIQSSAALPTRFCPSSVSTGVLIAIPVLNNGIIGFGTMQVTSIGNMVVSNGNSTFTNSTAVGFYSLSLTWNI